MLHLHRVLPISGILRLDLISRGYFEWSGRVGPFSVSLKSLVDFGLGLGLLLLGRLVRWFVKLFIFMYILVHLLPFLLFITHLISNLHDAHPTSHHPTSRITFTNNASNTHLTFVHSSPITTTPQITNTKKNILRVLVGPTYPLVAIATWIFCIVI